MGTPRRADKRHDSGVYQASGEVALMASTVKKSWGKSWGKYPITPKPEGVERPFDVFGAPTRSTATSGETANRAVFHGVNGLVLGFWGKRSPQFPNKNAYYPITPLPHKENKTIHNIITKEGIYIMLITLIGKRWGFGVNVSRDAFTNPRWRAAA